MQRRRLHSKIKTSKNSENTTKYPWKVHRRAKLSLWVSEHHIISYRKMRKDLRKSSKCYFQYPMHKGTEKYFLFVIYRLRISLHFKPSLNWCVCLCVFVCVCVCLCVSVYVSVCVSCKELCVYWKWEEFTTQGNMRKCWSVPNCSDFKNKENSNFLKHTRLHILWQNILFL